MKISAQKATLIKRYKRFLADVILEDGSTTTIHVANTGAMTGCATPNDTVFYSVSDNKKRKYPFSWELSQTNENHWICVNTIRANQLVEEALINQEISELKNFTDLKREVKYGNENSKIDFHLIDEQHNETFIEVKSVTLLEGKQGYFPDAKTERGQKHLREFSTPPPAREVSLIYHKSQLKMQLIEALKKTIDGVVRGAISFSDVKIISPLQKK